MPNGDTDWNAVFGSDDFKQLSPQEKSNFLIKYVPGYRDLPPGERVKFAQPLIQPSDAQRKEGVLGGMGNELWEQVKGTAAGLVPSRGNLYGLALPGGPLEPAMSAISTGQEWERRKEEGRSLPYRMLTAGAETAGIPTGARGMEEAAERGDTGAVVGHALVPAAEAVLGGATERVSRIPVVRRVIGERVPYQEPWRIRTGMEQTGKALNIPTSEGARALAETRGAPPEMSEVRDLAIARDDLAKIERERPVKDKGAGGMFQRAKNIFDYSNDLWEQAHKAQIERHPLVQVNEQVLVDAATREITPEAEDADPAGARSARRWIRDSLQKPRNLQSADKLLREINTDIESPRAQQAYGPVLLRVKSMVAKALRTEIDNSLEASGEVGVRDFNRRYGALRNVAENAATQAYAEAVRAGKAGVLPKWVHAYMFAHGLGVEGLTAGAGIRPSSFFEPKPSTRLARGMRRLSKTSLEPAPPPTAPPTPRIRGMLPPAGGTGRGGYDPHLGERAPGGPRTSRWPIEAGKSSIEERRLARVPGRLYRAPEAIEAGPRQPEPPPERVGVHEPASAVEMAETRASLRNQYRKILDDPLATQAQKAQARRNLRLLYSRRGLTPPPEPVQ